MKIIAAQIAPNLGDMQANFERHRDIFERARSENADLLVFPELSMTGYTVKDMVEELALDPLRSPYFDKFREMSRELQIVVGFIEEKDRGLFYNSAAYLAEGEIRHIHRKVFLPTYGMFEEGKFFARGRRFDVFPTPGLRTGMMICYDFLHFGAGYLLFSGGAEIVVVLSAAPGRGISGEQEFQSSHMWELMGESLAYFSSSFVVYCNRVGWEDGKAFAGGSFIYSPTGKLLAKAPFAEENLLIQEINPEEIRTMHRQRPYLRDNRPDLMLANLRRITDRNDD